MMTSPKVQDSSAGAAAQAGSGQMFDAIASRYDLLNRVISLGTDQAWRRRTVAAIGASAPIRVLDLATGTADLALQIAGEYPETNVVGLDPSRNMLDIGRQKVARAGLERRIELVEGTAEALPFDDNSFDAVTIAFGIRNVPQRGQALREMARVTRPGGRVAILELSEPRGSVVAPFARFHVHTVVPWLGSVLSGQKEYRYLQQSIAAFPSPDQFTQLMAESGLESLSTDSLTFGVCHLYVAEPCTKSTGEVGSSRS